MLAASDMLRTSRVVVGALVAVAAVTTLVTASDPRFGFDGTQAGVSVDTIAGLTSGLAAFLFVGRLRHTKLLSDAVLCTALLILALGNITFSVLPTLTERTAHVSSLARIVAALIGALLFALGSWLPNRRAAPSVIAAVPLFAGVAVLGAWAVGYAAGTASDPAGSIDSFGSSSGGAAAVLQGIAAATFLVATLGLMRRIARENDRLLATFAVAAVLAAASRFDFAVSTSAASSWVASGTLFRLAFYATLGIGAAQEIHSYWVNAARGAVFEERRRVARDLHDGMAQELAFIAAQARWLTDDTNSGPRAKLIASAAQRALDESRRAIAALSRPLDEPLAVTIEQAAEEVAHRLGVGVRFEADPDVGAGDGAREALLRIAREAVANAGSHSGAACVRVELRRHDGVLLRVTDDGSGFDPGNVVHRSGHLGLVSMRERAEAQGGRFSIRSEEGVGTTVEVWVP